MKKIFLMIWSLVLAVSVNGQDVPNLIPPSPEAASIVGYGNTGVNFYTGSPSLSIPIYTATSRGVSIPVSLSYSGFGGHKVEAVAPWVGLGWSLNAGGVVSRTIRGLADDFGAGYLNRPPISDLTDNTIQEYIDYSTGKHDGEPDEFNYNVNGMSGTFYLNRSGEVVQRVKSDVKVIAHIASTTGSGGGTIFQGITSFEVIGTDGTRYIFDVEEKSKSFAVGENSSGPLYQTNSWYLSSVKDQNGLELLSLTYHEFSENDPIKHITWSPMNQMDSVQNTFDINNMRKYWNYTAAKRIKEIVYDHGKIKFNASTTTRQDYLNDKWLDNIEVVDSNDNLIKKFTLAYGYFSPSGPLAINAATSNILFPPTNGTNAGEYERRLKLDSITEWDKTATVSNPPHIFTYNHTENLPSRYSFAQDHWGYYNGASNTTPESGSKIKYFDAVGTVSYLTLGSADREPSLSHAKANILTKVTYPTGGHTSFAFGQHQADELKNEFTHESLDFNPDGSWSSTNVEVALISQVHEDIAITVDWSHTCDIEVSFYNSAGTGEAIASDTINYTEGLSIIGNGRGAVVLGPGTYKVKASILGSGCSAYPTDNVKLEWRNEVLKINKDVGGLRIEAIEDHDGIDAANDIRREFYYNEAGDNGTSNTTGRIVRAPQYGVQMLMQIKINGVYKMVGNGFMRTISSTYPLLTTNGSEVGYGKVTVRTIGAENNGKTEYYFTTSSDYADLYDGYYTTPLTGEGYFQIGGLGVYETYPFTKADGRDYLRGLLTKQIDYRWKADNYYKTKEVENIYAGTFNAPFENGAPVLQTPAFIPNLVAVNGTSYESVEGIVSRPGFHNHIKRYRLYSGRADLQKTITKSYDLQDDTGTLYTETETTNFWDDLADDHYQISRTQSKDSEGNTYESKMLYPYNTIPGLDAGSQTVLNNMVTRNMIGSPIQQEQYKGTTKLSTTRTLFSSHSGTTSGQYYLPAQVQTAKGNNPLETRVRYHIYDNKGNPFELSQEDGTHIIYLWGYNQTFPVAQIQNATYTDILSLPAFGGSIDLGAGTLSAAQEAALRGMKGTLVTTMTYDVTVGMTSQTTPNGLTSYYEYDSFNRLKYVKDKDGNILRKMEYTYKVNANTTNN